MQKCEKKKWSKLSGNMNTYTYLMMFNNQKHDTYAWGMSNDNMKNNDFKF